MSTHNLCFEQKYEKIQIFLSANFPFFSCKIFNIFELVCFRNGTIGHVRLAKIQISLHICAV